MSRKSSEVIKEANKMFREGYVYVYGYKGTKVTEKGVKSLAGLYPNVFTSSILKKALTKVGKTGIDCSGFVNKAAGTNLGGSLSIKESFPKEYKKTKYLVDGMGIWRKGHIALVHVDKDGKAEIWEAKGTMDDLTKTSWKNRAGHFTCFGKISGVDYQGANVYGIGKVIGVKTHGKCNLYKKKDTKAGKFKTLANGTIVSIIQDKGDGWSKVWWNGKTGYIKNTALKYVGLSQYKTTRLQHDAYARKSNKKTSKKIKLITGGTTVKVICKRKYWSNVLVGNLNCWVSTKALL